MLVSPTEPAPLRALGTVSSAPEVLGADYLLDCHHAIVAVQRKEWRDLLASRADGRLAQEAEQMQAADRRFLLVEGTPRWTAEGMLLDARVHWDLTGWLYLQKELLEKYGVVTVCTPDLDATKRQLVIDNRWYAKEVHSPQLHPGGWGKSGNTKRAYQMAVLCAFPGVGEKTAAALLDACGKVPLELDREDAELLRVPGLGRGRLQQVKEVLK